MTRCRGLLIIDGLIAGTAALGVTLIMGWEYLTQPPSFEQMGVRVIAKCNDNADRMNIHDTLWRLVYVKECAKRVAQGKEW